MPTPSVEFLHKLRRSRRRRRPPKHAERSRKQRQPARPAKPASLKRIVAETMEKHAARSSKPTAMALRKLQDLETQAAANRLEVSVIKQRVTHMLNDYEREPEGDGENNEAVRETEEEVRNRLEFLVDEYSNTCDNRGSALEELNAFFSKTKQKSGVFRTAYGLAGGEDEEDDSAVRDAFAHVDVAKEKLQAISASMVKRAQDKEDALHSALEETQSQLDEKGRLVRELKASVLEAKRKAEDCAARFAQEERKCASFLKKAEDTQRAADHAREDFQREIAHHVKVRKQLQKDLSQRDIVFQKKTADLKNKLESSVASVATLEADLASMRADITETQNALVESERGAASLRGELQQSQENLALVEQQLRDAEAIFKSKILTIEREHKANLADEIELVELACKKKVQNIENKAAADIERVEKNMRGQLDAAKEAASKALVKAAEAAAAFDDERAQLAEKRTNELAAAAAATEELIEKLSAEHADALKNATSEAKEAVRAMEQSVEEQLSTQRAEIDAALSESKAKVAAIEEERALERQTAQAELEELRGEIKIAKAAIKEGVAEQARLVEVARHAEAVKAEKLRLQQEAARAEHAKAEAERIKLEANAAKLSESAAGDSEEIQRQSRELEEMTKRRAAAKDALSQSGEARERALREDHRVEVERVHNMLEKLQSENVQLVGKVAELQQDLVISAEKADAVEEAVIGSSVATEIEVTSELVRLQKENEELKRLLVESTESNIQLDCVVEASEGNIVESATDIVEQIASSPVEQAASAEGGNCEEDNVTELCVQLEQRAEDIKELTAALSVSQQEVVELHAAARVSIAGEASPALHCATQRQLEDQIAELMAELKSSQLSLEESRQTYKSLKMKSLLSGAVAKTGVGAARNRRAKMMAKISDLKKELKQEQTARVKDAQELHARMRHFEEQYETLKHSVDERIDSNLLFHSVFEEPNLSEAMGTLLRELDGVTTWLKKQRGNAQTEELKTRVNTISVKCIPLISRFGKRWKRTRRKWEKKRNALLEEARQTGQDPSVVSSRLCPVCGTTHTSSGGGGRLSANRRHTKSLPNLKKRPRLKSMVHRAMGKEISQADKVASMLSALAGPKRVESLQPAPKTKIRMLATSTIKDSNDRTNAQTAVKVKRGTGRESRLSSLVAQAGPSHFDPRG